MSDIQEEQKRLYKIAEENDKENLQYMSIEEALYQIQQRIKMHELEQTTSVENEREKVILNYINKLQEENKKLKELCDKYEEEHKTTFIEWQKDIKANKKAIEYINKHCVNEKVSKEVGYKCYTMADTNELEHIMKILGDDYE